MGKERFELFGEHCIKDNDNNARCQLLDAYKACVILNEQNERIKALEEKSNYPTTIIPKFKIKQEIYYIYGNEIRSMYVSSIEMSSTLVIYHDFIGSVGQYEGNCFATKEEAEQKLTKLSEEIKNISGGTSNDKMF